MSFKRILGRTTARSTAASAQIVAGEIDALTSADPVTSPPVVRARAHTSDDVREQVLRGLRENTTDSPTRSRSGSRLSSQAVTRSHSADGTMPLFEYFCVCGLRAPEQAPAVLYCSQAQPSTANLIAMMCFADAPPMLATLDDNNTPQQLNAASTLRNGDNSYFFVTQSAVKSADDAPEHIVSLYGFCVRHAEIFETPTEWIDAAVIERGSLSTRLRVTHRVYCIVSRFPYALLFFQLLWQLVRHESARLAGATAEARATAVAASKRTLEIIMDQRARSHPPDTPLIIRTKIFDSDITFRVPTALAGPRHALEAACFPALLRALTPDTFVAALGSVLVENKTVLVSRHKGRASACTAALMCAITPFPWQNPFVPLMPVAWQDMLDSPTPLLVGMCLPAGETAASLAREHSAVVVDLDRNDIAWPPDGVVRRELPRRAALERALEPHNRMLRAGRICLNCMCEDQYPFQLLDAEVSNVYCALVELKQYNMWLVNSLRRLLPDEHYGDPRDINNARLITTIVHGCERSRQPFIEALLQTQHYSVLAESFSRMRPTDTMTEGAYAVERL